MRAASLVLASVCSLALACSSGNSWNTSSGGVQEQPFPTVDGLRTSDPSKAGTTGDLPASARGTNGGIGGNAAALCDELAAAASKCGERVSSNELAECKTVLGRCSECVQYYRCALTSLKCKNGKLDDDDISKDCKNQVGTCFTCLGGNTDVSTGDPTPSPSTSSSSGSSGSSSSFADAGK